MSLAWQQFRPVTRSLTTRWGTALKASRQGKTYQIVTIPAFSVNTLGNVGAPYIAIQFDATLPSAFSLRYPVVRPNSANYSLAVSWSPSAGIVYRYWLWRIERTEITTAGIEEYSGEVIGANVRLEVWTVYDEVSIVGSEVSLEISLLDLPTTCCSTLLTEHTTTADSALWGTLADILTDYLGNHLVTDAGVEICVPPNGEMPVQFNNTL